MERIYVEIGNVCNLSCSFCPGTSRRARRMSSAEFLSVCEKIAEHTKYVYLHVMGEPLLHPELDEILDVLSRFGLRACITTNGVLLGSRAELLISRRDVVHKVSVSLHSLEGNGKTDIMKEYLDTVSEFSKRASDAGIYTVLRLWNEDSSEGEGKNSFNAYITERLRELFPNEWTPQRSGLRLMKYVFLEYAGVFTWPTESEAQAIQNGTCHGLVDQIAILADGTVTPCCLDSEGEIALGNIFEDSFESILSGDRAVKIKEGFMKGRFVDKICQKCTYARRFG